jgi:hypothetical protein
VDTDTKRVGYMSKFNYVIVVPVYKVNERVIAGISSIKDFKNLVIIDNSGARECELFENKFGVRVLYQTENIGVNRAWNLGVALGYDWTFIVSSSMIFPSGFRSVVKLLNGYPGTIFRTNHAWHCIGISREAFDRVGNFDENFYPGYLEDCDWDYRSKLAQNPEFENFEIDAICQMNGGANHDGVEIRILPLRKYFVKKWGGPEQLTNPGEEFYGVPTVWHGTDNIYKTPFNKPKNAISYWKPVEINVLKKRYGLP